MHQVGWQLQIAGLHGLCRGPISRLFRTYLWNARTPITNKVTIVAYICIYIALAIAWPVAVTTYVASPPLPTSTTMISHSNCNLRILLPEVSQSALKACAHSKQRNKGLSILERVQREGIGNMLLGIGAGRVHTKMSP